MAALGAEEMRDLGKSCFDGGKRVMSRDQADRVLRARDAAGRGGGDPDKSAPSQRQIELQAVVACEDGAIEIGQAGEVDHGIDDLFPVRGGMTHLALLDDGRSIFHATRRAAAAGGKLLAHVEFDLARQFDDGFGMMAVLEQRVFDGLGAADEQAAIEAALFLGDPLAAFVLADEDDGDGELHDGGSTSFTLVVLPKEE